MLHTPAIYNLLRNVYSSIRQKSKSLSKLSIFTKRFLKIFSKNVGFRQIKCLDNIVEQDHKSIKWIGQPILGLQSFYTASKTLK